MEERIQKTARLLKRVYYAYWLTAVAAVAIGEAGADWVGSVDADGRTAYYLETAIILLTACLVPLSLKLYAWVMVRRIDRLTIAQALSGYMWCNVLRMLLLWLPTMGGLTVYYLAGSTTGLLCALIACVASLFCVPGEKRLRAELHLEKED